MALDNLNVRKEERLKVKIGEAKQLPNRNHGSTSQPDPYCVLSLDQEEIYRTSVKEKTNKPYFGEEYQFDVPRPFRYISIYVYDRDKSLKQDRVLGKVAIKREDLSSYNNRDNWFSIRAVDADSEVQGKVNIEYAFQTCANGNQFGTQLRVRVVECTDLPLKNGCCDPYAEVNVIYSNGRTVTKKTKVCKKTVNPRFEDVFYFDSSVAWQDRGSLYYPDNDAEVSKLHVCIRHYSISGDIFLGENKIQLQRSQNGPNNAWYFLQPRSAFDKSKMSCATPPGTPLSCKSTLGSLRLNIQYTNDHVFPAFVYSPLKDFLLSSLKCEPITRSPVFMLGEIITHKAEIARPLAMIFIKEKKIVPIIKALALNEISSLSDPTTIFRGNTLVSKMIDETMKLVGKRYLHKTLGPILELIIKEKKQCEIDPAKTTNAKTNLVNLKEYVQKIFVAITQSAVDCPNIMCQIFYNLKECALLAFPKNREVQYTVICGFIFLRFFAAAILGPKLFDLTTEHIDPQTNRTLTLISKTIQSLGNYVGCRTQFCKEEYMECLYSQFLDEEHIQGVGKFLKIISTTSSNTLANPIDTPVILKEGEVTRVMTKRAQGRRKFGRKNFKQRYFKLTTNDLSYAKTKGKEALWQIPLSNILAVERLTEHSFKMKNMFQIVQSERVLYIQAANSVVAKEWIDLLTKICQTNKNRLEMFHPCAFLNGRWLCCNCENELATGCQPVSPSETGEFLNLDPERELQRVHSLIMAHINEIESQKNKNNWNRDTLEILMKIAYELQDEHRKYHRMLARETKQGSKSAPFGDDNYLLSSRVNLDSSFMRRGITSEPPMSLS